MLNYPQSYVKCMGLTDADTISKIASKAYTGRYCRDGSKISGKEVRMYKGMEVRFADFISFFLYTP